MKKILYIEDMWQIQRSLIASEMFSSCWEWWPNKANDFLFASPPPLVNWCVNEFSAVCLVSSLLLMPQVFKSAWRSIAHDNVRRNPCSCCCGCKIALIFSPSLPCQFFVFLSFWKRFTSDGVKVDDVKATFPSAVLLSLWYCNTVYNINVINSCSTMVDMYIPTVL